MLSSLRLSRLAMLLMFISLIAMTGCGDDDPTNPGDNNDATTAQTFGTITCTVDGTNWNFDNNGAGIESTPGWLLLTSGTADGMNVVLIAVPDAEGTYAFGTAGETSINLTINATPYSTSGQAGTLTITHLDATHVKGTFSGTAVNSINMTDTVTISNGTFDVSVVRIP